MAKPIILKSFYEIIDQLIAYKKQHKQYPIGSFRLNPQGKIIPDPHGNIKIKDKTKKNDNKNVIASVLELPKKLICSKCKKELNASKDRIKKLADTGKLDSYTCRSCK